MLKSLRLSLAIVAAAFLVIGCGSKPEEGGIDPGEIKTAPAGKSARGPANAAGPQKASAAGGMDRSTD